MMHLRERVRKIRISNRGSDAPQPVVERTAGGPQRKHVQPPLASLGNEYDVQFKSPATAGRARGKRRHPKFELVRLGRSERGDLVDLGRNAERSRKVKVCEELHFGMLVEELNLLIRRVVYQLLELVVQDGAHKGSFARVESFRMSCGVISMGTDD